VLEDVLVDGVLLSVLGGNATRRLLECVLLAAVAAAAADPCFAGVFAHHAAHHTCAARDAVVFGLRAADG